MHVFFPLTSSQGEITASYLGAEFVRSWLCLGFLNAGGMPVMGPGRT